MRTLVVWLLPLTLTVAGCSDDNTPVFEASDTGLHDSGGDVVNPDAGDVSPDADVVEPDGEDADETTDADASDADAPDTDVTDTDATDGGPDCSEACLPGTTECRGDALYACEHVTDACPEIVLSVDCALSGEACEGVPAQCVDATCTDGNLNGNETDTDCGGPNCLRCSGGEDCSVATDCSSSVCADGVCAAECAAGQYGSECTECPSTANGVCDGGGTCDDGLIGSGLCECDGVGTIGDTCETCLPGYAGDDCAACDAGFFCPGSKDAAEHCPDGTWDDDADSTTACIVHTSECAVGETQTVTPSAVTDRECTLCPDGTFDTDGDPLTPCVGRERGDLRLTDGDTPNTGRLEVYFGTEWGTVCDDGWDAEDAAVACRQLGFGVPTVADFDASGEGRIWVGLIACDGDEERLVDCDLTLDGNDRCAHSEDVGITCAPNCEVDEDCAEGFGCEVDVCTALPPQGSVRLGGGENERSGRVEVFYGREWGTVCDDNWEAGFGGSSVQGLRNGDVLCRQLGYPGASQVDSDEIPGEGTIWLDSVLCRGDELSLAECEANELGEHNCSHREDVTLVCLAENTCRDHGQCSETEQCLHGLCAPLTAGTVRLHDGLSPYDGLVEVFFNGEWGTVCDTNWRPEAPGTYTPENADVTCAQLGFGPATEVYDRRVEDSGPIWLDGVVCEGDEPALSECAANALGVTECTHSDDVWLFCEPDRCPADFICAASLQGTACIEGECGCETAADCLGAAGCVRGECITGECGTDIDCDAGKFCSALRCHPGPSDGSVRLANSYDAFSGRLEVFTRGEWGTVCSTGWRDEQGERNANLACRELGFGDAVSLDRVSDGTAGVWLDAVACVGDEASIFDCPANEIGDSLCWPGERVGLTCAPLE